MISVLLVTAMDLYNIVAVMLLFYGAVQGAKQALRGGSDIVTIPENNSKGNPAKLLALVIVEDIEESEESNPSMKYEAPMLPRIENSEIMLPLIEQSEIMLPLIENPEIMLPWIESVKPKDDEEDSSGESNSDEYPDSRTEDTDSDSNYYHADDYLKDEIKKEIKLLNLENNNLEFLRKNRWRSCQKTAAKNCRKACQASYKNACREQSCKKKLKKAFKKQCKTNCKDFFL